MFTVGHSTKTEQEFLRLLHTYGIQLLVDVRRFPGSRRFPHFQRDNLERALERHGVNYLSLPDLGGRRAPEPGSKNTGWRVAAFRGYADYMETAPFQKSFTRLLRLARKQTVAIMCAEVLPWRCHRRLIADAAVAQGMPVFDIMTATKAVPHELPGWARVRGGKLRYPGPERKAA